MSRRAVGCVFVEDRSNTKLAKVGHLSVISSVGELGEFIDPARNPSAYCFANVFFRNVKRQAQSFVLLIDNFSETHAFCDFWIWLDMEDLRNALTFGEKLYPLAFSVIVNDPALKESLRAVAVNPELLRQMTRIEQATALLGAQLEDFCNIEKYDKGDAISFFLTTLTGGTKAEFEKISDFFVLNYMDNIWNGCVVMSGDLDSFEDFKDRVGATGHVFLTITTDDTAFDVDIDLTDIHNWDIFCIRLSEAGEGLESCYRENMLLVTSTISYTIKISNSSEIDFLSLLKLTEESGMISSDAILDYPPEEWPSMGCIKDRLVWAVHPGTDNVIGKAELFDRVKESLDEIDARCVVLSHNLY